MTPLSPAFDWDGKLGPVQTLRLVDSPESLHTAAEILRGGGLVAIPTETVYGLAADALSQTAVARIFEAKQRPHEDPLILHVADASWVDDLAVDVPPIACELMARFWPGPLTLVLRKSAKVSDVVTAGGPTVAVRMPAHPLALALLRAVERPLAAPSANLFSRPSPTTAAHVLEDLDGRIDAVLDGGATTLGVESTVLDLTLEPPVLLRPGGITLEQLQEVLGPNWTGEQTKHETEGPGLKSPGLLTRHYSPRAEVCLFSGEPPSVRAVMRAAIEAETDSRSCLALVFAEDLPAFAGVDCNFIDLGSASDVAQAATRLYAALRWADREEKRVIYARLVSERGLGAALNDRLRRAASGRVIEA
jgi:L-threonylcarbamoyladenylate synthase